MFNNKNRIPKSEIPRPCAYFEHYYHKLPKESRNWNLGYIDVVSIDPARKNLAFRIERWFDTGAITPIVFTKINLEEDPNVSMYVALLNFLNNHKNFLLKCHIMVIEKQLHINYQAVRVSQHAITYFMTITQDSELLPSIFEVDPKLKSQFLQAPKNIKEKELKNWAIVKAKQILEERKDTWSLQVIEQTKKKDDLSDVIVQTEALFGYIGIAVITENTPKPILKIVAKDPLLMDNKEFNEFQTKSTPTITLKIAPPKLNLIKS